MPIGVIYTSGSSASSRSASSILIVSASAAARSGASVLGFEFGGRLQLVCGFNQLAEGTSPSRDAQAKGGALDSGEARLAPGEREELVERRDRAQVSTALRGILGLDGVATDMPSTVSQALDWFDAGLDFADALHVAGAGRADAFATFDERLVRKARRAGIASVSLVPR